MDLTRRLPAERAETLKHIVVLHADPAVLQIEHELLSDERYRVTTSNADNAAAALISTLQPDLVLIDLRFQDIVGWEVLVSLTDAVVTRDLPVIVTSTDQALLERARNLQSRYSDRRFLAVPFDVEVLIGMVHELIGPASVEQ